MVSIFSADQPTLPKMITFQLPNCKVNLLEEIGVHCSDFGALLLEDNKGVKISNIELEMKGNTTGINRQIVIQWLQGKGRQPVTWGTFIVVLQDINLKKLAEDIESIILQSPSSLT